MSATTAPSPRPAGLPEVHSELLLLPDGRILVHNLTQTMATVLHELNPGDDTIRSRVETGSEFQSAPPLDA